MGFVDRRAVSISAFSPPWWYRGNRAGAAGSVHPIEQLATQFTEFGDAVAPPHRDAVLHECLVSLPSEDFLYLGDDANFPYGTKSGDELRECVRRNVGFLLARGAKLLVVAIRSG